MSFDDEIYLGFYKTLNNWRERHGWFFLEERRRQKEENSFSIVWAPRLAPCAIAKQRFSVFFFDEREKERKKERPRWELF